jgi:FkbM family methyltransferase
MMNYIKKLTNPKNLSNFIYFIFLIRNPFIIPLSYFHVKNRIVRFTYNAKKIALKYRNIYDLAIIFEIFVTTVYPKTFIMGSKKMADVGAHCGYTAIWAHIINPELEIHSFEPDIENQEIFEENILLNNAGKRIFIHKYGLGPNDEHIKFYKYENNADNSTILHEGHTPIKVYDIDVKKAKDELEKIDADFLKVDIEGFEDIVIYDYFKGKQRPKYLSIEFSDNPDRKSEKAIHDWNVFNTDYINTIDTIIVNSILKDNGEKTV